MSKFATIFGCLLGAVITGAVSIFFYRFFAGDSFQSAWRAGRGVYKEKQAAKAKQAEADEAQEKARKEAEHKANTQKNAPAPTPAPANP